MHEPYASCVEIHDVSLNVIHARMNKTQSVCEIPRTCPNANANGTFSLDFAAVTKKNVNKLRVSVAMVSVINRRRKRERLCARM
jgi:hypothetical protein